VSMHVLRGPPTITKYQRKMYVLFWRGVCLCNKNLLRRLPTGMCVNASVIIFPVVVFLVSITKSSIGYPGNHSSTQSIILHLRLINLKGTLRDSAGKKNPTGQTALKKRVVSR
jgi:hypothetical protein